MIDKIEFVDCFSSADIIQDLRLPKNTVKVSSDIFRRIKELMDSGDLKS
jgi:hypothetical protein